MALANVTYTGDGTVVNYPITFDYLDRTHIAVFVDGVDTTNVASLYEFELTDDTHVDVTLIAGGGAVPSGSLIKIARITPTNTTATVFADGAVVRASALNANTNQLLYISQEVKDNDASRMGIDNDDKFDALTKVIKNVADPVNAQDAATKNYLENVWLTPSDKAQLNALNIPNLNTVANDVANVNTVATNIADVNTVVTNIEDVNTVVTNIADVNTVAGISTQITDVVADATDIGTVAADLAGSDNIGTVATNISDVNTVATNIADVITVANDLNEAISEIETAALDLQEATSEIDVVANAITNVDFVGNDIANVNLVAGQISPTNNISTVAGLDSEITTVAGDSAEINTVAGDSTAINNVNTNLPNINSVNTNETNINTVAGQISPTNNISTVAGDSADIGTLALISGDITSVADISGDVTAVANDATDIGLVATNILNVNAVAGNIADVNSFADTYFISGSAPSSPTAGDLWYDTVSTDLKYYNGSVWGEAATSVNGTLDRSNYVATAGQTTFSATYDVGYVDVYLNGVKLVNTTDFTATNGSSVVLTTGAALNDTVEIIGFGSFQVSVPYVFQGHSPTVPFDFNGSGSRTAQDGLEYLQHASGSLAGRPNSDSWKAPWSNNTNFKMTLHEGNALDALSGGLYDDGDTFTLGNFDSSNLMKWGIGVTGKTSYFKFEETNIYSDIKMATGYGIYLGGTGASNYIDDYEEGTWTPSDNSGAGLSFTVANATYTKVGRLVTVHADITYPSTADVSSNSISGLPFALRADDYAGSIGLSEESTVSSVLGDASASTFSIRNSSGAQITNDTLSGDRLVFNITYEV